MGDTIFSFLAKRKSLGRNANVSAEEIENFVVVAAEVGNLAAARWLLSERFKLPTEDAVPPAFELTDVSIPVARGVRELLEILLAVYVRARDGAKVPRGFLEIAEAAIPALTPQNTSSTKQHWPWVLEAIFKWPPSTLVLDDNVDGYLFRFLHENAREQPEFLPVFRVLDALLASAVDPPKKLRPPYTRAALKRATEMMATLAQKRVGRKRSPWSLADAFATCFGAGGMPNRFQLTRTRGSRG